MQIPLDFFCKKNDEEYVKIEAKGKWKRRWKCKTRGKRRKRKRMKKGSG